MQTKPTQQSQNTIHSQIASNETPSEHQYGFSLQDSNNHLLGIPVELLNRITSHLDPHGLFALSLTQKSLLEHVENDHTWRHAFLAQYLGVGSEGDIQDSPKHIMLRRTYPTWKLEFIARNDLIRRWARSTVGTVSHTPLHSHISDMVLLENDALLCSSIFYGVVSRSLPLTGKILPGFLDATGSTNGRSLGAPNGNPNAQFTPNVSSCAIAADGGTVRILWGYKNGLVSFMTTAKTMDAARRTLNAFRTCAMPDQHERPTADALWMGAASGWMAVTASEDGRVKLWDSNTAACLWASEQVLRVMLPEPVIKVAASYGSGCIAAVLKSGDIRIWDGFDFKKSPEPLTPKNLLTLACPYTPAEGEAVQILTLEIAATDTTLAMVIAYRNDPFIHRIDISSSQITSFGQEDMGTPSTVLTSFSSDPSIPNLILTGDTLGCVNVYLWDSCPSRDRETIAPVHTFEAYRDGSTVTSLAWNGTVLVTGSSRGLTHIFDGLSFERLKKIPSPSPGFTSSRHQIVAAAVGVAQGDRENVHKILLGPGMDTLFVAVGERVVGWKPGPVARVLKGGVRGRKSGSSPIKKIQSGPAKMSRQYQIKKFIRESKGLMEEEDRRAGEVEGTFNRQRAQLRELGLSETEAVEYILMMSREQAEAEALNEAALRESGSVAGDVASSSSATREATVADALSEEDLARALAEGMFDDASYERSSTISTPVVSSPIRTPPDQPRTPLRLAASPSNSKVQVLPAYVPEPIEAFPTIPATTSRPTLSPPLQQSALDLDDDDEFPTVCSGTLSPANSETASATSGLSSRRNSTSTIASSLDGLGGLRRISPPPARGAWGVPLSSSTSSGSVGGSPTNTRPSVWGGGRSAAGSALVQRPPVASRAAVVSTSSRGGLDEMDEDMRFAIELSLAEARSRGEAV